MAHRICNVKTYMLLINPRNIINVPRYPLGRKERCCPVNFGAVRKLLGKKVTLNKSGKTKLLGQVVHQSPRHAELLCKPVVVLCALLLRDRARGLDDHP